MSAPRIIKRTETRVSPWVRLVANEVLVSSSASETYHSLAQADYVAIVARLPDGRLPVVRQFRPAVASETWELPSGLLEPDEGPEAAARRELLEETGTVSLSVLDLGTFFPTPDDLRTGSGSSASRRRRLPPISLRSPGCRWLWCRPPGWVR